MNSISEANHLISREISAFIVDRQARGRSPKTIKFYSDELRYFSTYLAEHHQIKYLEEIQATQIRMYFLHLGQTRNEGGVSAAHRTIRAWLYWWGDEIEDERYRAMMKKIVAPQPSKVPLPGISPADLRKMLQVCDRKTVSGVRDRALLLFMFDTGVRKAECVRLNIGDIDVNTGAVAIIKGKGGKDRTVFLGHKGMRELLRYLRLRPGELDDSAPLWISTTGDNAGQRLKQAGLREILRRKSALAGVKEPTPHDFRRAFCLQYLRNDGDIFTLKYLMGHESLAMLLRYLDLAKVDLKKGHRKASPADNL